MILVDEMGNITEIFTLSDIFFVSVVGLISAIFLIIILEYFKNRKKLKPNNEEQVVDREGNV
jgi:hypothetical protein